MKPIHLREADFKREIDVFTYPQRVKTEFFEYWSEPNKSGTKMRFELEKTWHLGRRIARWANNGFGKNENKTMSQKVTPEIKKEPVTEIDHVDVLLERYKANPTGVPFNEFGKWYDLLKGLKLLRTFDKEDITLLRASYGDDNYKCRCACVQMTFDGYINTGLRFGSIIEMREKLNGKT